jgi:hypothetical protein
MGTIRRESLDCNPCAPHPEDESAKNQLSAEEFERAFEEIGDLIPDNVPPIPDEALRRENMYSRAPEPLRILVGCYQAD